MSDIISRRPSQRRPGGFTLIELVVVVAIIATTAGLVISRVDWVRRSADSATSVAGMSQVQNNLQMFKTVKGVYPDRLDSLLDSSTTASGGTPALYPKLFQIGHSETAYFELTTIPAWTPAAGAPSGPVFSLQHIGVSKVLDHSPTATFPGDSGTVERLLDFTTPTTLVTVKSLSPIEKSIYPTSPNSSGVTVSAKPLDVTLVALGVGPGCTANGVTMSAPPLCSAVDPSVHYPRYIGIFATYADGRRAELKAVVDSLGQVASAQLKNYYSNVPQ